MDSEVNIKGMTWVQVVRDVVGIEKPWMQEVEKLKHSE